MRCEDLTRELTSPTGVDRSAEMADHLAACSVCAEWSRRSGRLDRIWEATRPLEPSEAALDALWARASVEIEAASKAPARLRLVAPEGRRRWVKPAFIAAQAAAILLAALFLLRRDGGKPVELADSTSIPEPSLLHLDVEDGEFSVVRLDKGNRPRVEKQASASLPADNTPFDEIREGETMGSSFGTTVASNTNP